MFAQMLKFRSAFLCVLQFFCGLCCIPPPSFRDLKRIQSSIGKTLGSCIIVYCSYCYWWTGCPTCGRSRSTSLSRWPNPDWLLSFYLFAVRAKTINWPLTIVYFHHRPFWKLFSVCQDIGVQGFVKMVNLISLRLFTKKKPFGANLAA